MLSIKPVLWWHHIDWRSEKIDWYQRPEPRIPPIETTAICTWPKHTYHLTSSARSTCPKYARTFNPDLYNCLAAQRYGDLTTKTDHGTDDDDKDNVNDVYKIIPEIMPDVMAIVLCRDTFLHRVYMKLQKSTIHIFKIHTYFSNTWNF